jgi:hypothetical protein
LYLVGCFFENWLEIGEMLAILDFVGGIWMRFLKNIRACCGWFGCGLKFTDENSF